MKEIEKLATSLTRHIRRQRAETLIGEFLGRGLTLADIRQYFIFLDRFLSPRTDEELLAWHGRDKLYKVLRKAAEPLRDPFRPEKPFLSGNKNDYDARMQRLIKAGLIVKEDIKRDLLNFPEIYSEKQRHQLGQFQRGKRRQHQTMQPVYELSPWFQWERADNWRKAEKHRGTVPCLSFGKNPLAERQLFFKNIPKFSFSLEEVRDDLRWYLLGVESRIDIDKDDPTGVCTGLFIELGFFYEDLREYVKWMETFHEKYLQGGGAR